METNKTHIYFIPGLAASPKIFEHLQLPVERFELHYLEWIIPESKNESIAHYAKRMAESVENPYAILIGVSFGGIMAQEMSRHLPDCKVIIISSVKSRHELPRRLKLIQKTKLYTLLPTGHIELVEEFAKLAFGNLAKQRIELYNEYLSVRNSTYLDWAIYNVLHWKQEFTLPYYQHIHGDKDEVFPIKNIKNCTIVPGGSHVMIITKAKKISELLTAIL
jgi:pimeloyl-ACP methyl ester carboxylesterase